MKKKGGKGEGYTLEYIFPRWSDRIEMTKLVKLPKCVGYGPACRSYHSQSPVCRRSSPLENKTCHHLGSPAAINTLCVQLYSPNCSSSGRETSKWRNWSSLLHSPGRLRGRDVPGPIDQEFIKPFLVACPTEVVRSSSSSWIPNASEMEDSSIAVFNTGG